MKVFGDERIIKAVEAVLLKRTLDAMSSEDA